MMKRESAALDRAVRDVIKYDDHVGLVVAAQDRDVLFVAKLLAAIERNPNQPPVLNFPFACTRASDYLDEVARYLTRSAEAANVDLVARGHAAWPDPPLLLSASGEAPARRLRAAIDWVTSVAEGTRVVWGLLPATIEDPQGWQQLIHPLLPLDGVPAWMEQHRFFIRDLVSPRLLVPELGRCGVTSILVMDIDFGPERALDTLVTTVNDQRIPTAERMQALFQLAAVDLAYRRWPEALEKYGLLERYYAEREQPRERGLCFSGAGDVYLRSGDARMARTRYRQALALLAPLEQLGAVLPTLMGMATATRTLGDLVEAEQCYDYIAKIGGKLNNPWVRCDALEQLGLLRWQRRDHEGATVAWRQATQLARSFGDEQRAAAVHERLRSAHVEAEMFDELAAIELDERARVTAAMQVEA